MALVGENLPASAGAARWRFNPRVRKTPGEGNGNPPWYCLQSPLGRGAWWAAVRGVTQSDTRWLVTEGLSTHTHTHRTLLPSPEISEDQLVERPGRHFEDSKFNWAQRWKGERLSSEVGFRKIDLAEEHKTDTKQEHKITKTKQEHRVEETTA